MVSLESTVVLLKGTLLADNNGRRPRSSKVNATRGPVSSLDQARGCVKGAAGKGIPMILFAKIYYFVFAALTAVGGYIGFTKGSKASLIAGLISAALLATGAALIPAQQKVGLILALVTSLLLAGRFLPAFLEKKTWMPAGLMSVLAIAGLVIGILAFIKR